VASEWAALLAASGNTAKARIVLDELLELNPSQARAWAMLVAILVQDKDEQGLARCIERMRLTGAGRGMILSVAEGHRALMRNAVDEAQAHFENVLALKPDHAHVLDVMLRLDVLQRREDDAAERARMLLTMDPGNALANYIRGSIQLRDGQLMLAEDSFRKSLAGARRSEVLNDLAWLLQTREAYEEAERLAREALEMNDAFAGAWDTLGVILTKTERLSEAEEALTRSLAGAQGNPEVLLHLAELYARKGDKKRLRELVETLTEQERYLSRKQLKALGRLRAESE
jgi:Tfp pilus assembly protein PilF